MFLQTLAYPHTSDQNEQREAQKENVVYGMELGAPAEGDEEFGVRAVSKRSKVRKLETTLSPSPPFNPM